MLSFPIIIAIFTAFIIFAFLVYRFYSAKQTHLEPIASSPQQSYSDDLLEFDLEINKILNNPHLSDADKERLTNEYAEQYLLTKSIG
ncbi:hypothetical protein [Acinetobacter sp. CFCC 10889]|uniref:hypothetical protein n=1 Tax=Acinetobacter sp. CFCC 10889 TaxID=1775557 RepID=UPI000DCFEE63|nr:hypothetical protein [Acinetobacter sp. CFCC 10889]